MLVVILIVCGILIPFLAMLSLDRNLMVNGWRKILLYTLILGTIPMVFIGRLVTVATMNAPLGFLFNRLEHICLFTSIVMIVAANFFRYWRRLPIWVLVLASVGISSSIGLGVEFFQARTRLLHPMVYQHVTAYYADTLFDLLSNLIAGFSILLVLPITQRK
jgi:hypothetical protein